MSATVKAAFHPDIVVLKTAQLTPLKEIDAAIRKDKKYKQIAASLEHVGLIEPIVVFAAKNGEHLVLDGNKRLDILKARGVTDVRCLLATDDESYTYNKRVNYLPPIGEHHMILRAPAHGVTEARIAAALDVDVATIRRKRDLLDGICPETAELLKDRRVTAAAFAALRRMKPIRQIEVAQLMVSAHNYSRRFVCMLLAGTRPELLVTPEKVRPPTGISAAEKAMLERETDSLLRQYKAVEASYGTDVLTLSIACAYLERLLANTRINRYLTKHYPDLLKQLQQLTATVSSEKHHSAAPRRKPPASARRVTTVESSSRRSAG